MPGERTQVFLWRHRRSARVGKSPPGLSSPCPSKRWANGDQQATHWVRKVWRMDMLGLDSLPEGRGAEQRGPHTPSPPPQLPAPALPALSDPGSSPHK